ncbi:transporter substrate-binding domain-containing protein [Bdellovibrio sp. SKB1291214]|uniref:substrate-binding periplasmic protein n=1 Tax=Bdellovibrio sp. SKB1291214 TaxID=1732569 RepID=UPI0022400711|nr:transporter substrate-binding domain-containing protein [Bdellovibrio sp. SKB1291214]UYL09822.1 transporter substrate-binding domain-containing protein [Bdellovibrio sp. SKB1291214]
MDLAKAILIFVGLLPLWATAALSKKIQVYTIETPPTVVKTGEGLEGLSGTFGKVIASAIKKSGKEKEFEIVWVPWKRALLDLERNPQALFFPFTRTFEREYKVNWVMHLADVDCWLYSVDPKVAIHDLKDLTKYRIGVLGGSAREQELRRYVGNSSKVEGMTEDLSNFRKLQTGRIDIWATHPAVMAEAQKIMLAKGQPVRDSRALKKLFSQSMWMVGNRDMSDQNRNLVQSVFGWGSRRVIKPPPMTGKDFLNGALL